MEETQCQRNYYKNGQLQDEWPRLNGLDHGTQKGWYENGNKLHEYSMVEGVVHDLDLYWNLNGVRQSIYSWKNDQRNGIGIIFSY